MERGKTEYGLVWTLQTQNILFSCLYWYSLRIPINNVEIEKVSQESASEGSQGAPGKLLRAALHLQANLENYYTTGVLTMSFIIARNHCLMIISAEISLDAPLQPCWSGSQTMWGNSSLPTLRSHRGSLSCCAALSSTDTLSRHPQLSAKETEAEIDSQKRSEIMYRDSSLEIPDFLPIYNLTNRITTQRKFHLEVLFYWSLSH